MGKKRKRPSKDGSRRQALGLVNSKATTPPSRARVSKTNASQKGLPTTHPVISLYYPHVLTLRQYLLRQLPVSSKLRRRRIATLRASSSQLSADCSEDSAEALVGLLDSTLVGVIKDTPTAVDAERSHGYRSFIESQSRSVLDSTDTGPTSPQSEIVNFVIESLFARSRGYQKSPHLLGQGYAPHRPTDPSLLGTSILGLVAKFPNSNVRTLKQAPWSEVLALLGQDGDEIMIRLLFDCGIFAPINAKRGVYYQLSGTPLSELAPVCGILPNGSAPATKQDSIKSASRKSKSSGKVNGCNNILFLRRRMLYSRSQGNSQKEMKSGLGAFHVLNRFQSIASEAETCHVMKYMFPRQFGLQNVFDSGADSICTTSREQEISLYEQQQRRRTSFKEGVTNEVTESTNTKLPRRLRGKPLELVRRLRARHSACQYRKLLDHYCPDQFLGPWKFDFVSSHADENMGSSEGDLVTQPGSNCNRAIDQCKVHSNSRRTNGSPKGLKLKNPYRPKHRFNLTDYASPASAVSAFCRAALHKILPIQCFGEGPDGVQNRKAIMDHVDSFIKMRRFESPSLHQVCSGLKITNIPWLAPPRLVHSDAKLSLSDFRKRTELFHELIYFIFDSLLIPLLRNNFYVTESQSHRNHLFYYRHDVWRKLIEKPMADLKTTMFEQLSTTRAQAMLGKRSLGLGALRLLPKASGLRPILNLRKRFPLKSQWGRGNNSYLGASVNSSLAPVFNMLTYERERCPEKLGASLLSVGDLHSRLKVFRDQLTRQVLALTANKAGQLPRFYFVKVDIQACFDTIPQKELLRLVEKLVSEETYHVTRYVVMDQGLHGKAKRRFLGRAAPPAQQRSYPELAGDGSLTASNTVFIDNVKQKAHNADELLCLLDEHVRNNLVKVGKKYLRQRNGIPQGSVVSSLLCNFFYAQLEQQVLDFLRPADSLLLRLIDDFLLITTDAKQANEFLQVMHRGQPSYGVSVNPHKSMVNFTAAVDGVYIPRLEGTRLFPYCGCLIDTHTLEIHKDQDRMLDGGASDMAAATLSNTLTVETDRLPGHAFHRKIMSMMRPQLHFMYLDTEHNSREVVLSNLYTGFITTAMRMYRYMKLLRGRAHLHHRLIVRTIHGLIQHTTHIIRAGHQSGRSSMACSVHPFQLQHLASAAFRFVLRRKQTRYAPVLQWLEQQWRVSRPTSNAEAVRLLRVIKKGDALFGGWRF
ncbi:Uncharacterized protein PECH_001106 [Penicillium ucsense]|uniref:Telomerase reverse transcriptase n=1 Tax=Penicillium ucsense TaxID=2839758 RepID=A0A8J8W5X5_9EURO|nr:Uncharacterized protein PECM_002338 [Penicillium ucsense]KAF7738338.1 Uncharacterized protein PECH_001106 [Penicillium ucsense]